MIREFSNKDATACCEIARENWSKILSRYYPKRVVEKYKSRYTTMKFIEYVDKKIIYVFDRNKKILAFTSFSCNENSRLMKIERFFVRYSHRNQGIGTRFFQNIKNRYPLYNFSVESSKDPKTINFYKKNGFIEIGKTKHGIIMVRKNEHYATQG